MVCLGLDDLVNIERSGSFREAMVENCMDRMQETVVAAAAAAAVAVDSQEGSTYGMADHSKGS